LAVVSVIVLVAMARPRRSLTLWTVGSFVMSTCSARTAIPMTSLSGASAPTIAVTVEPADRL
jgi:hypothetical protein